MTDFKIRKRVMGEDAKLERIEFKAPCGKGWIERFDSSSIRLCIGLPGDISFESSFDSYTESYDNATLIWTPIIFGQKYGGPVDEAQRQIIEAAIKLLL